MTGDNKAVARHVAAGIRIDEVIADVLPANKVEPSPPTDRHLS